MHRVRTRRWRHHRLLSAQVSHSCAAVRDAAGRRQHCAAAPVEAATALAAKAMAGEAPAAFALAPHSSLKVRVVLSFSSSLTAVTGLLLDLHGAIGLSDGLRDLRGATGLRDLRGGTGLLDLRGDLELLTPRTADAGGTATGSPSAAGSSDTLLLRSSGVSRSELHDLRLRLRLREGDARFESRQRRAQAKVDAVAEGYVVLRRPIDVETLRVGELLFIMVGRGVEDE